MLLHPHTAPAGRIQHRLLGLLGRLPWGDLRADSYHILVNTLGGSAFVPRSLRRLLYGALGMPNGQSIHAGCTSSGRCGTCGSARAST